MNKNEVFLLLGSNLGNRQAILNEAIAHIEAQIAPISAKSSVYQTAPWGVLAQPSFLNQVVCFQTVLHPIDILQRALKIEQIMGRERRERWDARLIDIDLLYCGSVIVKMADLMVPHPRLHERRFTLVPLAEIAPKFVHPVFKQNNQQLLDNCVDTGYTFVYEAKA